MKRYIKSSQEKHTYHAMLVDEDGNQVIEITTHCHTDQEAADALIQYGKESGLLHQARNKGVDIARCDIVVNQLD